MRSEATGPALFGIVGPTASDKSALAMAIARRLPVEILVADSRQVYRGMDIGTAKPEAAARAAVPHHLLDLVDPDERFTVAHWVGLARELIPQIVSRKRSPLLVGGAGLYVAALVDGHEYGAQTSDPQLRARLADELTAGGLPRARPYAGPVTLIGLHRPREVLYRRIDERARRLFAYGLLDEVRSLLDKGYGRELRPMTGHGYAEAMRYLAGEWTLEQAIEVTARRTRQYAKRQLTWFRHQARVTWLNAGDLPGDDPGLVAQALDLREREPERDRLP